MRKTKLLTPLNALNCCEVSPNGKLIYVSTDLCKLQKQSGQFENSVFVIVGNTPYPLYMICCFISYR